MGRGDTVAVLLPNCVELVVGMFAAWWLGAALTPINPALTDPEVRYQLQDSTSVLVIGDVRAASIAGELDITHLPVDTLLETGDPLEVPMEATEPDDFALVIYTSGTTGQPKGVLLDHANLTAMSDSLIQRLRLSAADVSLLVLPLFHVNGLVVSVLSTLRAGGSVVVGPKFSPATFWDAVETYRPTYFSAVPTMYALIESHTERAVDTSSLRLAICGAAPMHSELIQRFDNKFSVPVVEGYGLSEGTVASTLNPPEGPRKAGTVGTALPGQEVAVIDKQGNPLPPGASGEVVIRGGNVMRGYLGRPEASAAVLQGGWLHTGDVGVLDDDGYLTLVDRLKDMIIRGGENIYPKEIEIALYEHPCVLEAAVIGRHDDVLGEVPVAFVAAKPGTTLDPDELSTHCAQRLARYKRPAEITVLPTLPKNSVGKLVKGALRDVSSQRSVH